MDAENIAARMRDIKATLEDVSAVRAESLSLFQDQSGAVDANVLVATEKRASFALERAVEQDAALRGMKDELLLVSDDKRFAEYRELLGSAEFLRESLVSLINSWGPRINVARDTIKEERTGAKLKDLGELVETTSEHIETQHGGVLTELVDLIEQWKNLRTLNQEIVNVALFSAKHRDATKELPRRAVQFEKAIKDVYRQLDDVFGAKPAVAGLQGAAGVAATYVA